ncbi:MAG: zinc-ribbon domain-containing protein [Thermomicrobiales bacterium]
MSEQSAETRACPTCGSTIPAMARYCPSCGTRLNPTAAYSADDFEDALADVLDEPDDEQPTAPDSLTVAPDEPTAALPPINETATTEQPEWTARASDWVEPTAGAGSWTAPPPSMTEVKPRGNRTLWIVLAIVGFIVFCCCGAFFALFAIDASTSAFQDDMSRLAMHRFR